MLCDISHCILLAEAGPARQPSAGDPHRPLPRAERRHRPLQLRCPRAVTLSTDADRALFLRSTGATDPVERLWLYDLATGRERLVADPAAIDPARTGAASALPPLERRLRERIRLWAPGIGSFAATGDLGRAVFALDGRVFRCDTATGTSTELPVVAPAFDPARTPTARWWRTSPTGRCT
ncbi:hypothetical protein ACFQ2M_36820 [Kitasatospora saccharophila]|uniref:hypothetical protein n=1 Tax=Kitasatospora saccharophila TaxID=407973 RepID=UPI0036410922